MRKDQEIIEGFINDPEISEEEKDCWREILKENFPDSEVLKDV